MARVRIRDILEAKSRLVRVIRPTPLIFSDYFSDLLGRQIYFKPESFQLTGSFKARGAYYKLWKLSQNPSDDRTVICASAGNHAQGLAFAGKELGFRVKVVMPQETPLIKVEAVRGLGAEVLLFGESFEQSFVRAKEIADTEKLIFVHPYDDPLVIAGQGTVGLEIKEELPDVGTVIVPVGGGGLVAGVSLVLKGGRRKKESPLPKIIGVRSQARIAEGILVKEVGSLAREIIDRYVDEMLSVEEGEIALAILTLMEKSKLIVEGAGAVGLAALLSKKIKDLTDPVVVVLSGGNIDINLIGKIIEKGLHQLGRRVSIVVDLEDVPGTLHELTRLLAEERANIDQIIHERSLPDLPLAKSRVKIVLETQNKEHIAVILEKLKLKDYQIEAT